MSRPRTRKTYVDKNGRRKRICRICKRHLALNARNFSPSRRDRQTGRVEQWSYECKRCAVAKKALWKRTVRETKPEHYKRVKARHLAYQKRWREENPEKVKAAAKRRAAAVKADPQRHARELERRRIEWALRAERLGIKQKKKLARAKRVNEPARRLPAEPLVRLVERLVDQRRAVAGLLEDADRPTTDSVCQDIGLAARDFRRMKTGEQATANIGLIERVLLNAGVDWYEVYSFDDHAAQFLATEIAA